MFTNSSTHTHTQQMWNSAGRRNSNRISTCETRHPFGGDRDVVGRVFLSGPPQAVGTPSLYRWAARRKGKGGQQGK